MIRRPQRKLTDAELQHVAKTKALNLHGAFILGIVDPVPSPSPMSEDEGTWVREHVWPDHLTEIDVKYPWGFWRWANCEHGTCWNCLNERCDKCLHRDGYQPQVGNRERVHSRDGRGIARLYTGNESCTWWCRCPCDKTGPIPGAEPLVPASAPTSPELPVRQQHDALFELDPA